MYVKVLGAGCPDCEKLHALVGQVAAEEGLQLEIEKVAAGPALSAWGLSRGPGLVVDGDLKSKGSVPSKAEVVQWLDPRALGPQVGPERHRRYVVLGICSLSLFMVQLDNTIVNVALPSLQHQFRGSIAELQWVVDAYLVVLAALLLLGGSLGDRFGRRRVLRTGLVLFGAGSLACSFATSVAMLVAFRMLQAVGGSMLNPNSLSIVTNTFRDPKERARAIGFWAGVMGVSMAAGPLLGGALIEAFDWRAIFWVNVPVAVVAVVLLAVFVPESRAAKPRRLDPAGQVLAIVALGALTYGVIEGPSSGWTSTLVVACFGVFVTALASFVYVEQHQVEPLVELRFFRSPTFSGASAMGTLSFFVVAGWLFLNTLYLQEVRGYSPLLAGAAALPAFAVMVLASPLTGRLVARRGPRLPIMIAGVLLMCGSGLLVFVEPRSSYLFLAVSYVLIGCGYGMVNPPVTTTAVSGMPLSQAGVASGVLGTVRQVGSTLGVAVLGSIVTSGMHSQVASGLAGAHLSRALGAKLARASLGSGALGSPQLPERAARLLLGAFATASHAGWAVSAGCAVVIVAVALATTGRRAHEVARQVMSANEVVTSANEVQVAGTGGL
jgi:EmrB/QacA subfamily drug resistance transporter